MQCDLQLVSLYDLSVWNYVAKYVVKSIKTPATQPLRSEPPQITEEWYKSSPSAAGFEEHEAEGPEQEVGKDAESFRDKERKPIQKFHSTRCDCNCPPCHVNDRYNTRWHWDWNWEWDWEWDDL